MHFLFVNVTLEVMQENVCLNQTGTNGSYNEMNMIRNEQKYKSLHTILQDSILTLALDITIYWKSVAFLLTEIVIVGKSQYKREIRDRALP